VLDYYGLHKISPARIQRVLATREGDPFPNSKGDVEERLEHIPGVVRSHLEAVCCDSGKPVLFVGIEEKGAAHFSFRTPPAGEVRLTDEIRGAYREFLTALEAAVRAGNTDEDLTNGHSLMANPACRAQQEKFITYADKYLDVIRDVLRNSFDEEHRAIAAYVIGYAGDKKKIVDDLLYAIRDPDETVRNNAMRALAAIEVLATRKPTLEIHISPTWLVEMLNSLVWTDRTTAAVNLVNLTETRDPEVLGQLRDRALPALIDMAEWKHLPHALPAFILVGRVSGAAEKDIQDAWSKGERERMLAEARKLIEPKRKK